MDINDLDPSERAVLRALQRVGGRWPNTLRMISVGGGLSVAYVAYGKPDELIAAIPGIALGGEWQRHTADRWWYEFTAERKDALYTTLEPSVRLLLHTALGRRHRLVFTEAGWEEFRESAHRCGVGLRDIQRTPVLPAEDVV